MKLTGEERDYLTELTDIPGYKVLLKVMDIHVQLIEQELLKIPLDTADAPTRLAYQRARAEGAKKLVSNLKAFLTPKPK